MKQEKPILVIIGNPPYNAFSGVSPREEGGLVDAYKVGLKTDWGVRKYNLDDPYIRFFRVAERRIAEQNGRGVVCLITNFSYLDEPSFVVMRKRLIEEFDLLWLDSLNGDSRRTGKRTPGGKPDPSVFSTPGNPAGIQIGTAVALLAKKTGDHAKAVVRYREFWGEGKRSELVQSLDAPSFDASYQMASPEPANRYSFRPIDVPVEFRAWPLLTELASERPYQGVAEDRRKDLIDPDRSALESRMRLYFDSDVSWDQLRARRGPLTDSYVDFSAQEVRRRVLTTDTFDPEHVVRYLFRPFDIQWCYESATKPLWRRNRPDFSRQAWPGNSFLLTRLNSPGEDEGAVAFYSTGLCDYHALEKMPVAFPMLLRDEERAGLAQVQLFATGQARANLSGSARSYLSQLGLNSPDQDADEARLLWMHSLAVISSPLYLTENRDGLRRDLPHVPLPVTIERLVASGALGRRLASLLDVDHGVEGVSEGELQPVSRAIGIPSRLDGMSLDPKRDLSVTVSWGVATRDRKVMPGLGRALERAFTAEEAATLESESDGRGASILGVTTFDLFLNDQAYWRNVPENVWRYTVGGNQVLKKWLSYREASVLGRPISPEETRHFAAMCRRIASILLLAPELDLNYEAVKVATWDWPRPVGPVLGGKVASGG